MGWRVWGEYYETTSDLSNGVLFCPIKPSKKTILLACRTWVIVYGDPVFTALSMSIYSNRIVSGKPTKGKLLFNSTNSLLKSEIHSLENGVKEIYFNFDLPVLRPNEFYHFVLKGTGYSPTPISHLAWMKTFPDPFYPGVTPNWVNMNIIPYQLYLIGAEL
jgi:hypothetical protein